MQDDVAFLSSYTSNEQALIYFCFDYLYEEVEQVEVYKHNKPV